MSLKRFMLAMAGVAMFAALAASNASAEVTTGGSWYEEGVGKLPANTHTSVGCEIAEHNEEKKLVLVGKVGTNQTAITLTATGVECVEGSIFNDENGAATDQGKLKFTGVTVSVPPNCSVEKETVETNLLHTELYMDTANPSIAFDKFEPAEGIVNFAVVHITGAECAVAGNRPAKGTSYGKAVNATGVQAVKQPLEFSAANEETATGHINLEFAGNPATLTGKANNFLTGVGAVGKKFWAE